MKLLYSLSAFIKFLLFIILIYQMSGSNYFIYRKYSSLFKKLMYLFNIAL
jgi:hypothetical protein